MLTTFINAYGASSAPKGPMTEEQKAERKP
jgi:hypothetical protein